VARVRVRDRVRWPNSLPMKLRCASPPRLHMVGLRVELGLGLGVGVGVGVGRVDLHVSSRDI
jgi:hypothetical protein